MEEMLVPERDTEIIFYQGKEGVIYYITSEYNCLQHIQSNHLLAFVYSGIMLLSDGTKQLVVANQTCAFIRKNHRLSISFVANDNKKIKVALIVLQRNMLLRFYQGMDKAILNDNKVYPWKNFSKVNLEAGIESIFLSLVPYINAAKEIPSELMELKLTEVIYGLLYADKSVAPALFDFTDPWKVDIVDFLNKNLTYNFALSDLAQYTGRSVAAFKRDFNKVSDISPQKWILKKRLELAQLRLNEGESVSDIYLDLGFLSLSHFSTAYKKEFGRAPTKNK